MQGGMPPGYAGAPPVQHMGVPQSAPAPAASPGKPLKMAGIGLAVAGVVIGGAMFVLSGSTEEETVKKFARAPAGCTTTLEFDKTSAFTLYIETKGSVSDVGGDCGANGTSYERGDDDLPAVTLTLVDEADQPISLSATSGPSYDVGGFAGQGTQRVQISAPGTYRLTVDSADTDFAIAIGGAPDADSSSMQSTGIIIAVAGLLLGGLLFLLGSRKGRPTPAAAAPGQWQQGPGYQQGYPPQGTVPGYQPQQPAYTPPPQPTYQQPPQPTYQQPQPPQQPPQQPPPGQGWGAPQQ